MKPFLHVVVLSSLIACTSDKDGEVCPWDDFDLVGESALRNPEDLTCRTQHSSGDACGETADRAADTASIEPPWGLCDSECDRLPASECALEKQCRLVVDASCVARCDCLDAGFVTCVAIGTGMIDRAGCTGAGAEVCSLLPHCAAYHRITASGRTGTDPQPFAFCAPEDREPGACYEAAVCGSPAPSCAPGTHPGVSNGCFSGACIPEDLCEPRHS